jgi:predicted RNA-binding protein YlxR (DUF448 family)
MRTPPNESLTSDIVDVHGAEKSAPERKCILSGEHGARDTLVRLAISPAHADGSCDVLPDPHAKAPGRGAWLGVSRAHLEEAMAKGRLRGALARAYKGASLNVPEDLPQRIADALNRVLLDRLGLELRSGNLILGSDRIGEQARIGAVGLLLHASDASEGGASKLDQAWRVGSDSEGSGKRGIRLPLDRAALSVALGRENVVHLGVSARGADARFGGGAAARVNTAVQRLLKYSGAPAGAP